MPTGAAAASSCSQVRRSFTLMNNVSQSLAGRADIVELETLSLAEIRAARPETGLEWVTCSATSSAYSECP